MNVCVCCSYENISEAGITQTVGERISPEVMLLFLNFLSGVSKLRSISIFPVEVVPSD